MVRVRRRSLGARPRSRSSRRLRAPAECGRCDSRRWPISPSRCRYRPHALAGIAAADGAYQGDRLGLRAGAAGAAGAGDAEQRALDDALGVLPGELVAQAPACVEEGGCRGRAPAGGPGRPGRPRGRRVTPRGARDRPRRCALKGEFAPDGGRSLPRALRFRVPPVPQAVAAQPFGSAGFPRREGRFSSALNQVGASRSGRINLTPSGSYQRRPIFPATAKSTDARFAGRSSAKLPSHVQGPHSPRTPTPKFMLPRSSAGKPAGRV